MLQRLRFVNQGGIPAIQSVAVNTVGTVTTFSFNSHPVIQTNHFSGFFVVRFPDAINQTTTNTIKFDTQGVSGSDVDVYSNNGALLTIGSITSTAQTVHLFFYDRDNNRVQLIS